ncbi:MAG: protein BatD [Bacteroidales bacterium]|nr:protein BatD [Bacteroidales bacterium]MBQ2492591.1 protein BatD [Bacteroidales bacterium]MBQ4197789.1 protein BatD [Bacteroidales bacterium]
MKNGFLKITLFLAVLVAGVTAWGQNSFKVEAPNVVEQGERFLVRFIANGDVDQFNHPSFTGADVIAGPSKSISSSTTIINGKRTSSYSVTYTYVLEASDNGVVNVSEASAEIEGSTYTTKPVSIEIVENAAGQQSTQTQGSTPSQQASSQQNNQGGSAFSSNDESAVSYGKADLFLRMSLNKTKVVKGEPIIATLKIYTRSNIRAFEDIKWPVFNGFWSQETEAPQNLNFTREKVGNQIYQSAVIRRYMLMPQQTGTLTIDPSEMVCQVEVLSRPQRSRSILDDLFDMDSYSLVKKRLSTGKITVHVSDIPSGAPSSFGGGVGKLSMNVRLTKDSLNANEAASLIIELSGSGNLNLLENPSVVLPSDFERYDAKSTNSFSMGADGYSGKKTIEYPFIPRGEGVYEIPPVQYSYFDLSQRRYLTLNSDTITVKVGKGSSSNTGGMYVPQTQKQVSNLGEDIRYLKTAVPSIGGGTFFTDNWIYYLAAALLVALFFVLRRFMDNRIALEKDVVRSRNRKANKVARQRLKLAQTFLSQNKVQDFYEELHKAILGYTADKLSIQRSDLQRDVIQETLLSKKVPKDDIDSLISLLDDCEMVRYSPEGAAGAMDAQYRKAVELISGFENKL